MGRCVRSRPKLRYVRGKGPNTAFKKFNTVHLYRNLPTISEDVVSADIVDDVESPSLVSEKEPSNDENGAIKSVPPQTNYVKTRSITASEETNTEYFIASTTHLNTLINESLKNHNSECKGNLELVKHQQRMLSTSWHLKCNMCDFISSAQSMTNKKALGPGITGPKPSTLNEALGFALLKSSIGATQFKEIMLSLGISCGSLTSIQQQINKCGKAISAMAEENMFEERQKCKYNQDLGITLDGWYPTKFSCGPWQASTQTTFTAMEAKTRKILAMYIGSKMCPQATKMRNLGIEVDCPFNHDKCTANLSKFASIGQEGAYASEVATTLKNENMTVSHFCSDADSKTKNGFLKVYPNAEHYLDKNHLSRSLKRGLVNAKYSKNMFSVRTAKAKARAKTRFAGDMKYRVESEFRSFFTSLKGTHEQKLEKMTDHVKKIIPTILECFKNNHTLCDKHSRVCTKTTKWNLKHKINPSKIDEAVIKKVILNKRLGPACLEATIRDISTQGNEAFNRLLSKTSPKTISNAVNFRPRMHAAVLLHNLGSYGCSLAFLKAAEHKVSSEIKHSIAMMERANKSRRSIAQSSMGKKKRAKLRNYKQKLHDQKYDEPTNTNISDDRYEKDINLPTS